MTVLSFYDELLALRTFERRVRAIVEQAKHPALKGESLMEMDLREELEKLDRLRGSER